MTESKRWLSGVLIFFLLSVSGCVLYKTGKVNENRPAYSSYREITGVTEKEIELIEQPKLSSEKLLYGMCTSAETFYDD